MALIHPFIDQRFGGYAREFYTLLKGWLIGVPREQDKFVLFGRGRSGSTLLTQMLNSNPKVTCDKEIFNRRVLFPRLFVNSRKRIFKKEVYGFKLLSYQLREHYSPEGARNFMQYLAQKQGYKIVYLTRENPVLQTMSKHYARFRGTWHQTTAVDRPEKMVVDIPLFMQELRASVELDEFEAYCLQGIPSFKVVYEHDLKNSNEQFRLLDRLSHFLRIPLAKPNLSLKKISSEKVSDYVENWEELKHCISYTEFSRFADFD